MLAATSGGLCETDCVSSPFLLLIYSFLSISLCLYFLSIGFWSFVLFFLLSNCVQNCYPFARFPLVDVCWYSVKEPWFCPLVELLSLRFLVYIYQESNSVGSFIFFASFHILLLLSMLKIGVEKSSLGGGFDVTSPGHPTFPIQ